MTSWALPLSVFITITVLAFLVVVLFRRVWRKESRLRTLVINLFLSLFSVLYLLVVVELFFAMVFVQSNGLNNTLVSQRWFEKYWHPINADGYRDYDHTWSEKVLFVVGDSFIAGHGIKNIDDRLAGVLARKLGSTWTVAVLAKNGWNLTTAYNALIKHNRKPDRIIISYFLNDISLAARQHGLQRTVTQRTPSGLIKPFVDHSYLFNWLYWRLQPAGSAEAFWDYFGRAYNDEAIWTSHTEELQALLTYAAEIDADLSFIIWPRLSDIENSTPFTSKVAMYLEKQQVDVIDLSKLFISRKPESLIVNPADGHPNVAVNAEVAELLYEALAPWD